MKTERIQFSGHDGNLLAARLELPDRTPNAYAIFAHCFTCGKDSSASRRISRALAASGVAVLRFDFTGLGQSGGDFGNTHFTSNVQDLIAAANWLREAYQAPALLIGHSLGGAAVLAAAGEMPELKAVAVIGAPSDPGHVSHLFEQALPEIAAAGKATVSLAGRPFEISQQFVEDIRSAELTPKVANLRRALLVAHSPTDDTVGIENAAEIFQAAKHPKSFISLDNADHLVTRESDAIYLASIIAAWAARYIPMAEEQTATIGVEDGVRVVEVSNSGFLNDVYAPRKRHVLADEPKSVGGSDLGFTPMEFLDAALGACTSMTLRMYATRKKLPLERVDVHVVKTTVETPEGKQNQMIREIRLIGDLTPEQRQRMLEIADRCPVHHLIEGHTPVITREALP